MIINPNESSLIFSMSEYDCFKLSTGKCSLLITEDEYKFYKENHTPFRSDCSVDYCRNLYESINRYGITDNSISVRKYECGHYTFQNGQHRTCIFKRKKMDSLQVKEISAYKRICPYCIDICREKPILGLIKYEDM
ncbi:hypothetical protein [Lysinibacillus pakistanensis]|uniref:Uncharacterized protein n=1 Tax=Lysinibacillus pakistanensis TaxID=759811 RepID=A0ABX6D9Z7_9BACI|nr:hypothetical protein GDS87_11930 [Lysinibacillus pakistanensis]